MALYNLAEVFPEFLAHAPRRATSTLVAVMDAYVARYHAPKSGEAIEASFTFDGGEARIRTDHSVIWDEGDVYRDREPLKMLDAFERHLEHLAERSEDVEELRALVEILVEKNRFAVLWRRLLLLGVRFPYTLGRMLLPLAQAMPILVGIDTTAAAGEFLRVVFPELAPNERERVERVLLSIPDADQINSREVGERIRDRLLGCLTDADLITDEARRLLTALRVANAVPSNDPLIRFGGGTSTPYSEEEYLAGEGVPVETEGNRKIRDLEQPVTEFVDKHRNSMLSSEEIATVLPVLRALQMALSRADIDGVHPKQQDYAWAHLAAACHWIARQKELSCRDVAGAFTQAILMEASRCAEPTYHPESDAQFDEHLSWGSAARIEAAQGLILLARHTTCATTEVLQTVERLSADPVSAVRFQIADSLNVLYLTAPDLMWWIVERLCREEPSRGVLQGLLNGALARLAGAHPDRAASLAKVIYDRIKEGPGASKVRELCIDLFTLLYIWRDHTMCREIVFEIAAETAANPNDAQDVLHHLRGPLTHGPVHPPGPKQDAIRQRAFDLVARLLRAAHNGLRYIETTHTSVPFNALPEADQERTQSLLRLIDNVGYQMYFASGAFDGKRQGGTDQRLLTREERERFYREAGLILDELAEVGIPSLAHHLLETLETFIPFDPRGVFLRIGRIVQGGQKGGYQYESLAADLMVRLIERYLAEYRGLLRENEACRQTLLEVLDIFVQAGWPSAQRLTYRLEEIFR